MSRNADILSSFIQSAPPGEVRLRQNLASEHTNRLTAFQCDDGYRLHSSRLNFSLSVTLAIETITRQDPTSNLGHAYKKYNEEQFTTVKLPGGSQQVQGRCKICAACRTLTHKLGYCELLQRVRPRSLLRPRESELLRIRPRHTGMECSQSSVSKD